MSDTQSRCFPAGFPPCRPLPCDDAGARALGPAGACGGATWRATSWMLAAALGLALWGCQGGGADSDAGDDAATDHDGDGDDEGLELGQGAGGWEDLPEGGEFQLWLGGQGLYMFPLCVRLDGLALPEDPGNFDDPLAPDLALEFDVPGHNIGIGGWFYRIANYPLSLVPADGGGWERCYVALILPDDYTDDPLELDGLAGTLHVHVEDAEGKRLDLSRDLMLATQDPPIEDTGFGDAQTLR